MLVDPHTGTCRTVEVEVEVEVEVDYAAISSGFRAVTALDFLLLNRLHITGLESGQETTSEPTGHQSLTLLAYRTLAVTSVVPGMSGGC